MTVKVLSISNFKSFENVEVELHKLNVLIGANASGKSNFVEIFRFLRDTANHGLDNSISMQGGVKYLRNMSIGPASELSLRVVYDPGLRFRRAKGKTLIEVTISEAVYEFAIRFHKRGEGFSVVKDAATAKCEFTELERADKEWHEKGSLGTGESSITKVGEKVEHRLEMPESVPLEESDIMLIPIPRYQRLPKRMLLLETPFLIPVYPFGDPFFEKFAIYDFDPRLPKQAVPITGKTELEEDGSNLAIVLKNINKDKEKQRKFANLVTDLLPFVEHLDVDKFAGRSLFLKLRETFAPGLYLPAYLVSDGTMNVTALVVALYFEEKKSLIVVEEPERNIHPHLISKVVSMLEDASDRNQIIVTTHNPELVRHVALENLLLVRRDKRGFSAISRPGEREKLRIFLEHEIGIEELYVQDLLGA